MQSLFAMGASKSCRPQSDTYYTPGVGFISGSEHAGLPGARYIFSPSEQRNTS